jgi:hypothetical protein
MYIWVLEAVLGKVSKEKEVTVKFSLYLIN